MERRLDAARTAGVTEAVTDIHQMVQARFLIGKGEELANGELLRHWGSPMPKVESVSRTCFRGRIALN